jgi:hypothetical protein
MSAVLLAVFQDYEAADRARVDLVRDGFPTDRVEVTAACEPGRAGYLPAEVLRGKFVQYFRTLLKADADRQYAESLAERLDGGAAALCVHPRGPIEISRASNILKQAGPVEVTHRNLESQTLEHAAARHDHPWISHLWLELKGDSHCIYCRLFESRQGRGSPSFQR